MAEGARRIAELADEIDTACAISSAPNEDTYHRRIKIIDIGGGLSVNYYGDNPSPTFEEYYVALRSIAPNLFQHPDRLLCTGTRK